jgi:transposase
MDGRASTRPQAPPGWRAARDPAEPLRPRMGRVERRLLIKQGRKSGDPATALRLRAVARLALGKAYEAVADELDVGRSTVIRAASRFVQGGVAALYDQRRFNGAAKVDQRFLRGLGRVLRQTPEDFGGCRPTWTRELLCAELQAQGFPRVAVCTMGRALARIGARLGSPKPIVLCPWRRDARLLRLAQIRALEARASAAEPVLYSDEVDIHLNPKIGRDWMLPAAPTPHRHARQEREVLHCGCARRSHRPTPHDGRTSQDGGAVL